MDDEPVMDDENTQAPPPVPEPPRQKRKYQRRVPRSPYAKKVRPMPREPEPLPPPKPSPDEATLFAGMTGKTCAAGCGPNCVITGDICAHPYISGGLQSPHRMKPPVIQRFEAAKRYLKHQAIELDPYGNQRKEA